MADEERDIVEFSDDDGNTLLLEVLEYFFYNGEEYAVLGDAEEGCGQDEGGCGEECHCEHEHNLYIMKVVNFTSDDGEEMEEYIPVEEEMMDQLIEVVQTRFSEEDDDFDDDDDDDEEAEEEEKE